MRHPSVREKEERWAARQRGRERRERGERERSGGRRTDKLQTACGCTDKGCETHKKKREREKEKERGGVSDGDGEETEIG